VDAEKVLEYKMAFDKIQWIKDHQYICISPSSRYDFRITNDKLSTTCCCNLDSSITDGTPEYLELIKETNRQKQNHPACWICYKEEDDNVMSERMRYLIEKSQEELELIETTQETESIYISIKFSNLCNLACRSCNPYESSLHAKLYNVEPLFKNYNIDITDNIDNWNTITRFIKKTYDKFNTTKKITVCPTGGETLLQPGFQKLLEWMIDEGISKNIGIAISTSLSVSLTANLVAALKNFRDVHVSVSIDSVGKNYNQVRWPLTFDKLQQNLQTIFPIIEHSRFTVVPTFSLNNIFYMLDILNWWNNWFNNHPEIIIRRMSTIHLYQPEYLVVENIPTPYRQMLIPIIDECYNHPIFDNTDSLQVLKEYIELLKTHLTSNTDGNSSLFTYYLEQTAEYDRRTKTDSFIGNQKLFSLLTQDHVDYYYSFLKN
jgi:organic radical activating enzyme